MQYASARRALALGIGLGAVAGFAVTPAAHAAPGVVASWDRETPTAPSAFTADPLPTVQVDGIVRTVEAADGHAWAGGEFTQARPAGAAPGTQETPRGNLLAFDLDTGALDPYFVAHTDGAVRDVAVTDDGTRLLVAGDFTQVNGQPRQGFAVLDARTGAVDPTVLDLDAAAYAVAGHGSTAYVAGPFTTAAGQPRAGVAAVDLATGELLPFAPPAATGTVHTMVTSPGGDQLVVGGQFSSFGPQQHGGIARLDTRTGAVLPTPLADVLRTGGPDSGVYGLDADEQGFYVGGWKYLEPVGFEGTAAADWNGDLRWIADCHGDIEGVWSSGGEVHAVGHPHNCATVGGYPESRPQRYDGMVSLTNAVHGTTESTTNPKSYVDFGGLPAPRITAFNPAVDAGSVLGQSTHAIDGDGDVMVVGGEFPRVQGVAQQGLVRFARGTASTSRDQGPEYGTLGLRTAPAGPGRVQVLVTPTWDRDDTTLTYRLTRGGVLVDERRIHTARWAREDYVVTDTLASGDTVYTLTVTDDDGNTHVRQAPASVALGAGPTDYGTAVTEDGAVQVWGDVTGHAPSGGLVPGLTPEGALELRDGATLTDGLLGQAIDLRTPTAMAPSRQATPARNDVTVELWVQAAPGARAGRLLGFSPEKTAPNELNDRALYLDHDGHVAFGTWTPHQSRRVRSVEPVTDGNWHHVVGTMDAVGTHRLYVDGVEVDSMAVATGAGTQDGHWRLGADDMSLFTDTTSSAAGAIVDAPAVYHRVLPAQDVAEHHTLGAAEVEANPGTAPQSFEGTGQVHFTDELGGPVTDDLAVSDPDADTLVVGDWNGDGIDDVGHRSGATFHLIDRATGATTSFAYGRAEDEPYVGDWDGDGRDTVAVRRGNQFHVRNSFTAGAADETLTFGRAQDEVLVGDWDGNGSETLGVRRGNLYYVLNSFRGGWADEEMLFGRAQDAAFAGDWDGNGSDSIALRRGSTVFAADDFAGGNAPTEFSFGRADDRVYIGDWSGTGKDGMMLGRGDTYFVADELKSGWSDRTVTFPTPSPEQGQVLVGRWGGDASESLALYRRP